MRRDNRRKLSTSQDYNYLKSFLSDNIDMYILGFEEIDPQMNKEYASKLKEKLEESPIYSVEDVGYSQVTQPNPQKLIQFADGQKMFVPEFLVQKADEQKQLIDDNIIEMTTQLSEPDLQTAKEKAQITQEITQELIEKQQPQVDDLTEIIDEGEYRYIFNKSKNDLSIQRLQDDGSFKEVMSASEFQKVSDDKKQEIIKNVESAKKLQDVAASQSIGEDIQEPITAPLEPVKLENIEQTLEEDSSKFKQLGEKAKTGFKGLSSEQKAMGLLLGLEVGSEALNFFGPARKEARQRKKVLEERRAKGQLGVDEKQDAETMKYMTRPIRAIAEESEREQQAVMAGMGETRSAADLRRLRQARESQITDAMSSAGREVARQQMARAEAERRELNQLQAYQQENLRNLTNRLTGSVAQIAGTFGANKAAEASFQEELAPEKIDTYMKILKDTNPNASDEELRKMATDFGIERANRKLLFAGY